MTRILPLLALLVLTNSASAQFDVEPPPAPERPTRFNQVADYFAVITPNIAKRGEEVTFKLTVTPRKGAWTYPASPKVDPQQPSRNRFTFPPPGELIFVGAIEDPAGAKTKPRVDAPSKIEEYYPTATTWKFTAIVSPNATPGKHTVQLGEGTSLYACTKSGSCLPSPVTAVFSAEFEVSAEPAVPVPAQFQAAVQAALTKKDNPPQVPSPGAVTNSEPVVAHASSVKKIAAAPEKYLADLEAVRTQTKVDNKPPVTSFYGFLATAAFWGFISLVTPCVFPMIPITVSIFLKQSHQSTAQTLKLAGVYCLTIIVVLGISAFALLKVFVELSVNPVMNLFLGGLFVVFALSLFGMYDLTLPQGLLKFTQKRQGSGGVVGTVFGALAFTIIGFTCVAPFLGGFAGLASSGSYNTLELILGAMAFSTAFASPFFLLALFPRLLKSLPRSGGWLDSVKAVMGFLELAAALKFLRTAEIGWSTKPDYFTYDLVLAGWVAIAGVCGIYLLNMFRLPHDEEKPNIGVPRLIFALGFLGLSAYLFPAMLKTAEGKPQRPGGVVFAWVDSFLLPEPSLEGAGDLPFSTDLKAALDEARQEKARTGKPSLVFVDFTGVTCTNCKYNENNVFTNPAVKELLKRFKLVQLYTDWVPEQVYVNPPSQDARKAEAMANRMFKEAIFETEQLPYYVILEPLLTGGVKVVGVYDEGKINDPARFATFLRDTLEKGANP